MNHLKEPYRLNDLLKWEQENRYSREKVIILAGEDLPMGAVIGKEKTSCPDTGTPGSNTGNGTCTGVTAGDQVKKGTYTLTCIGEAANAGTFEVKDPDDITLGQATVGVAYNSEQINFTINDGSEDFDAGDTFTVTVTAGTGKVKKIDFNAGDGTEDPYGFTIDAYNALEADLSGVAIVRDALIDPDFLAWPLAFTSGGNAVPAVGDIITGDTSSDTGEIVKIDVVSGSWAGGDAAGILWLSNVRGEFQAENLDIDARDISNFATIAAGLTVDDNLEKMKQAGILLREGA